MPEAEEQRLKTLTDPESIKKKLEKEKTRPPLEVFRSQIAPNDVLPFVKANHWTSITLEARSNYNDFVGSAQTAPVKMTGMPLEIVYRRDMRLAKTQTSRLTFQMMLPKIPKEINVELTPTDGIRPDEVWPAAQPLGAASDADRRALERADRLVFAVEQAASLLSVSDRTQRRDRRRSDAVLPPRLANGPGKAPVGLASAHVDDDQPYRLGRAPSRVSQPPQQEALVDWLHWGGQLVIVGGPGQSFSLLKDSFLSPYLPGELSGETALLSTNDLAPMSAEYPPPAASVSAIGDDSAPVYEVPERSNPSVAGYRPRVPIRVPESKPVFLAGLKPHEGAVALTLGAGSNRVIGVEGRVGRGRVLLLGFSLIDPSIATWPGFDTFFRRVVLRRPEESPEARRPYDGMSQGRRPGRPLSGPELSWLRYLTRDIGSPAPIPSAPSRVSPRNAKSPTPRTMTMTTSRATLDTPRRTPPLPSGSTARFSPGCAATSSKERPGSRFRGRISCSKSCWPTCSRSCR